MDKGFGRIESPVLGGGEGGGLLYYRTELPEVRVATS